MLASVAVIAAWAICDVGQIHLAIDNSASPGVTLTWVSKTTQEWTVVFGSNSSLTGENTVNVTDIPASAYTYEVINASSHDCYTYNSPSIFRATLSASVSPDASFYKPGSTIYYKVVSVDENSPVYSFVVPSPASAATAVKLAMIGDLGQTENSSQTIQHVLAGTPSNVPTGKTAYDAVVIVGDLSYADAENLGRCSHPGGCDPTRWDSFGDMYTPLGSSIPTMTCPGNHEIELVSVGDRSVNSECNVTDEPFLEYRFRWFSYATADPISLHYSWDIGNVHMVMLNSYSNYVDPEKWNTQAGVQYKWLQADLAAVDRKVTPWIVVQLHAPWYNSNSHHQGEIEETDIRPLFEPLLHQYGVDVLFAGHVHAYERTYPVLNGKLAPPGTSSFIEINIGDGGNREGPAVPWCTPISSFPWSAYRDAVFGHGSFETFNSTHARWSWIRNNASEWDTPGDDVWLVKSGLDTGVQVFDVHGEHAGNEWAASRETLRQHEFTEYEGLGRVFSPDGCPIRQ